jgi:hypothetical protein
MSMAVLISVAVKKLALSGTDMASTSTKCYACRDAKGHA